MVFNWIEKNFEPYRNPYEILNKFCNLSSKILIITYFSAAFIIVFSSNLQPLFCYLVFSCIFILNLTFVIQVFMKFCYFKKLNLFKNFLKRNLLKGLQKLFINKKIKNLENI